jgi:predicted nucleic acid-binding protein
VILDTTYFVDLLKEDEGAFSAGTKLRDEGTVVRVPTVVFAEVYYGVEYSQSAEELRKVKNVMMGYPPVPLSDETAQIAAELLARADADHGGDSDVGWNDAYVAATSVVYEEPVLTRNAADFEALGVEVQTY